MKKAFSVFLSFLLSFSLFACSNDKPAEMPNPMQPVNTLDELSEKMDASFMKVDKACDESFNIINSDPKIGEYSFTLNGKTCVLRFSKNMDGDISGIYTNGDTLYPEKDENTHYIENDDYKATRWFTVDGQYIFFVKDDGEWEWSDYERISSPFLNMEPKNWNSNVPFDDYLALTGIYSNQDCYVSINIKMDHVEINASELEEDGTFSWTVEAYLDGNKLAYEKETSEIVVLDLDNFETSSKPLEDGPNGYILVLDNGSLDFTNVNNEKLKGKVFEAYFD